MLFEESLKYRYKGIIIILIDFFLIEIIIEKKYKINSLVYSDGIIIIKNLSKILYLFELNDLM